MGVGGFPHSFSSSDQTMTYLGRFKTIIFDFDGVILDSARLKTAAFAEIYKEEASDKIAAVVDYQERHGGIGRREKFAYFEKHLFGRAADDAVIERLSGRFGEIIDARMLDCPFIPGARDVLASLKGVATMHLVSGMPDSDLKAVVEKRGLSGAFRSVAGSPKTKHAEFLNIMAVDRVSVGECLAVGDSLTEFHAARKIGIPFLAIVAPDVPDRFPDDVAKLPDLTHFADGALRAG